MKVRRYQAGDAEPIARLNERLRAADITDVVYPEGAEQHGKSSIRQRLFVAEDDGEIRGGVWLKEQPFRIRGQDFVCGWLKYPVAESLIDPKFSGVPASLLMQCLREQPRLLGLGLGGQETPLARMLRALRWTGITVPLLVRILRPRSLRQIAALRRTAARRAVADFMAMSGLGWLGLRALELAASVRAGPGPRDYSAERCDSLGSWTDEIWLRTRDRYQFLAARGASEVEAMLPSGSDLYASDVHRLRVRHAQAAVGWVYVVRHDFSVGAADKNFGRLTVGLVGDCLAAPEHAAGVMQCAVDYLAASRTDVVVSNQLHPAWVGALRSMGFFYAPSTFALFVSPTAVKPAIDWSEYHVNRGDNDGPMWYYGR